MSTGSTIPYNLRPNKAADRELFLSLLARLCGTLPLETYRYVGLGGPFLEDFRMVHSRLGISHMTSVEMEKAAHLRQAFNRPFRSISCVHAKIEEYLKETDFDESVILWLDYTKPEDLKQQIDCYCEQAAQLPLGSIVRITMNANPSSLGNPANVAHLEEYRVSELRRRLGNYVPTAFPPSHTRQINYGRGLLSILRLALDRHMIGYPDRKTVWALSTYYADGQPMVTATVIIVNRSDEAVEPVVAGWPFRSTPECPHVLELPVLSPLERATLERADDPSTCLKYDLPVARLKQNPLENFTDFYRVYPQFARVDL